MKQNIGSGIFVGFAIGLGVGAIAGLFFAPKSGEQLRDEIARQATDGLHQVRSAGKKIGKQAQTLMDQANNEINNAVDAGQNAYTDAKNA